MKQGSPPSRVAASTTDRTRLKPRALLLATAMVSVSSCTSLTPERPRADRSLHARAVVALVEQIGADLEEGIVSTTRPRHDIHSTDAAYRERAEALARRLGVPAMSWDEAFDCGDLSEGCRLPEGRTFVLEPLPVESQGEEERNVVLKYITTSRPPLIRMADAIGVRFYRVIFDLKNGEWVVRSVELFGRSQ